MGTFKNVIILLGAFFIPLGTAGFAFNNPESRAELCVYALLLLSAVYLAYKKKFFAMVLYLAGIVFVLVFVPKVRGLGIYFAEGSALGQLCMMRIHIDEKKKADGVYPQILEKEPQPLRLGQGHKSSSAIDLASLSDENYLFPPEMQAGDEFLVTTLQEGSEQEQVHTWNRESTWPVFLYPGLKHTYAVRRAKTELLVSSGTLTAPLPPGFIPDSGRYTYDQAHGHFFINCTHLDNSKGRTWWRL